MLVKLDMASIHHLHSLHTIRLGSLKNDSATSDAKNCYLKKKRHFGRQY